MNEHGTKRRSGAEIALLDVLTLLAQRRRFIAMFTGVCGVVALITVFVMPHTFQATVSILPPEKSDRTGLSSLLLSAPTSMLDFSSMGENHSSDYFLDVLRSRTIVDSLFVDYPEVHDFFARDIRLRAEQEDAFTKAVSIESGRDGMVTVTVKLNTGFIPSHDEQTNVAKLSAQVAGGLARELDKLNRVKIFSRAHNSRVYIEGQVQRIKIQLDSLYTQFAGFQKEYKVLALDKQVESEVKSAAELQSQIMELEYQLRYRLRSQTSTNMETQQLRERLASLKEEYAKLQGGGDSSDYFLPFPQIPALQKQYANMVRDLKATEQVYAYLQTQYFQERVQEERDTPTVQVLDAPMVPERRSSPHRGVLLIISIGIGFVLACISVILREYVFTLSHRPEEHARMQRFLAAIAPRSKRARRTAAVGGGDESESRDTANGHPPTNGDRT